MSTARQAGRFVVAGLVATAADALVYTVLLTTGLAVRLCTTCASPSDPADLAKACSFLVGTLVSYTINKWWTFQSTGRGLSEAGTFFVLYASTFLLNVGIHRQVLLALPQPGLLPHLAAFVSATSASTVANFVGQKLWVFRAT